MCQFASCKSLPEFNLRKGPIGRPPDSGWKIQTLPPGTEELGVAWAAHPSVPDNSKAAWSDVLDFLALNGFSSPEITRWALEEGPRQWCSMNPERCDRKWLKPEGVVPVSRYFPWAKTVWENFNLALHDGQADVDTALKVNIGIATGLINSPGPTGCPHCATHWQEVLAAHPVPPGASLQDARIWLWTVHNLTREGLPPVAFETVAAQFNWTTP